MSSFSLSDYLNNETEFENFETLDKAKGEHNQNFIFESEGRKYVLRKKKQISDQETLEKERKFLEFLEHKEVDSAPRSISFDPDNKNHIISFVGEEEITLEELNIKEIREWAEKVAEINKIEFEQFKRFCKDKDYSYSKPEKPREKMEQMKEDLDSLNRNSENKEIIEFAENKLDKISQDMIDEQKTAYLTHSDLANSTRRTGDTFYFIDWEFASFNFNQVSELGMLLAQKNLTKKQEKALMETYREKLNDPENFEEKLEQSKKLRHIFNIIWALKRSSRSEEEQRYLRIAERQEKLYSDDI